METKGRLQLAGALVTDIEIRNVDTHLEYISIALESDEFVGLLGSNRIRLVFLGCPQLSFGLCMWSGQDNIHSFYIKDSPPDRQGRVLYCVEMSGSTLEIMAKGVQVELSRTTHQHH